MKNFLLFIIEFYKRFLSSLLKSVFGGGCRYQPTCSEYAKDAIERFGVVKGSSLALKRIFSCHPFGKSGYDPVPVSK